MTKQAYYKHDESRVLAQAARDAFALEYIKHVRTKDPGIGGVKLWHMYRRDFKGNDPLGRDRFVDIINEHNLKVRMKVRKPRTTDSSHGLPTYPNLVNYIHHHLGGCLALLLLLSFAHPGCLYRGNRRLERGSYARDRLSAQGA